MTKGVKTGLVALLLAAGLMPEVAAAFVFGELNVRSLWGQVFEADLPVSLDADEDVFPLCLRLTKPLSPTDETPFIAQAKIDLEGGGRERVIKIRGRQRVNEPAIKVVVQNSCDKNGTASKEFTVLLDFPSNVPPVVAPLAAAAPEKAAAEPAPAPSEDVIAATTWTTRAGDTLLSVVRSLHPNSPKYPHAGRTRERMLKEIANANPSLKGVDRHDVLPEGLAINIPATSKVAAEKPAGARKSAAKKSAAAGERAGAITPSRHPKENAELKISRGAGEAAPGKKMSEKERVAALEKQMQAEADTQSAKLLEEKDRETQLEGEVAQLQEKLKDADAAIGKAQQAKAQQAKAPESAPAPPPAPEPDDSLYYYIIAGVLAAALIGGVAAILYRSRRKMDRNFGVGALSPMGFLKKTKGELDPSDPLPWMKEFEKLHAAGDKDAFGKLAVKFLAAFHESGLWEQVKTMGRELQPDNPWFKEAGAPSEAPVSVTEVDIPLDFTGRPAAGKRTSAADDVKTIQIDIPADAPGKA